MRARYLTQQGPGTSTARTPLGPVVSGRRKPRWQHPWQTTVTWAASGQWIATVKPGFVNDACPTVRTSLADQRADTGAEWQNNPLTGKPFLSDGQIDLPLYLRPALRLAWREIGWDAGSDEAVPQFFQNLGAAAAPHIDVTQFDANSQLPTEAPTGLRLLRASDVWVHQPRAALTSQVTVEPGLVTGLHNYTQTLSFTQPLANDALRVMSGTMDSALSSSIDVLAQDYTEQPWDELLIARAYVLSPPDTIPGSKPDATWTPFVQHSQFWNLAYVPTRFQPPIGGTDPGISLFVPLAGGVAQPVINVFTSTLNDATSLVLNELSARSLAGTFYVATGGGSDAAFPVEPAVAPQGSTGADKSGRIQAQTRAAAVAKNAAALDPVFPFRAAPFMPALLKPSAI